MRTPYGPWDLLALAALEKKHVPDHPGTLERFDPIGLAEMDSVKLQDRMDSKFTFPEEELEAVLTEMALHYRCLEVDGKRGTAYRSLYLDTPGLRSFTDHHNGRTFRCKVRYREYVGSGLCFLEVKRKTGRGRTDKRRKVVAAIPDEPTQDQLLFIREASGITESLRPVLWNHFTRYTFVHRSLPERLTIDLGLRFSTPDGTHGLEGIVVAEVKQERVDRGSPFMQMMRRRGHRPSGMSKYCIGALLLNPALKYNAFKPTLLHLRKLAKAA